MWNLTGVYILFLLSADINKYTAEDVNFFKEWWILRCPKSIVNDIGMIMFNSFSQPCPELSYLNAICTQKGANQMFTIVTIIATAFTASLITQSPSSKGKHTVNSVTKWHRHFINPYTAWVYVQRTDIAWEQPDDNAHYDPQVEMAYRIKRTILTQWKPASYGKRNISQSSGHSIPKCFLMTHRVPEVAQGGVLSIPNALSHLPLLFNNCTHSPFLNYSG